MSGALAGVALAPAEARVSGWQIRIGLTGLQGFYWRVTLPSTALIRTFLCAKRA